MSDPRAEIAPRGLRRRPATRGHFRRGGAMRAAEKLAGAPRLLDPAHQNSSRGHREVEKKLANSPRVFLRPEKVRGKEATRGGGKFSPVRFKSRGGCG